MSASNPSPDCDVDSFRWGADALSRLPPNIAKLAGLPPAPAESSRRRGFALGGGMFAGGDGGDTRDGTEMTTPEVLRSTR